MKKEGENVYRYDIGTSIIGGNNNTVFPMFAEIRGFDINIINIVSGIACIMKAS